MANWNSGAYFNRKGNEGGFTWNSKYYLFVVRINDTFNVKENVSETLAKLILTDKAFKLTDMLENMALYDNLKEEFRAKDEKPFVTLLVSIMDEMGMKDEFTGFLVNLYLNENQKVLDEVKLLVELLEAEIVDASDITDLHALYDILDQYNLDDLKMSYQTYLYLHDLFGLIDRDPKSAESDLLLGHSDDVDTAYDYLIPLNMRVDYRESDFQIMPPVENTEISLPGTDGVLIGDTTYKTRLFKLVCYSEDGLTVPEKEDLKRRITEVLDSTKHQTKKLTIQARGISFDVKYEDSDAKDGPSFVKNTITFSSQPYGYDMFEQELYGGGLIYNEGVTPLRPKFVISGYVVNPSFNLNGNTYRYAGTIFSGSTLTLDFEKYTCFVTDSTGKKTNALAMLTGEFTSIEPGKSAVLVPDSNTSSHIYTTWRNSVLW